MKLFFCTFLALLSSGTLSYAQSGRLSYSSGDDFKNPEPMIKENVLRAAGSYHCYEAPLTISDTPSPKGFKPFYISHYGRHGSRYHTPKMFGRGYPRELLFADSLGLLTDTGREVLSKMLKIASVHEGMVGELSVKGFKEHEGIADRMFSRFPSVFERDSVKCISSNYTRCILSMSAFTGTLRARKPALNISQAAGLKYFNLLAANYGGTRDVADSLRKWDRQVRPSRVDVSRIAGALFTRVPDGIDLQRTAKSIYIYGCIAEALEVETGGYLDLLGFFTPEELNSLWAVASDGWYGEMCGSQEYGAKVKASASRVLKIVLSDAERAMETGSGVAANLRFGHDDGLMPLIFLLDIEPTCTLPFDGSHRAFPSFIDQTASNLQFIFYRNRSGKVLVKILYNEQETFIHSLKAETGPYYSWDALRTYLQSRSGL